MIHLAEENVVLNFSLAFIKFLVKGRNYKPCDLGSNKMLLLSEAVHDAQTLVLAK